MEEGFIIVDQNPDTNIDNLIYENIDNLIYKNNNPPKITQNNLIIPYKKYKIIQPIIQPKYIHNLLLYFVITYKLSTISWALLQSPFLVSKHILASNFI